MNPPRNPTIQRLHRTERGTYTAAQLAAGWRAAKAAPAGTVCQSSPWSWTPISREAILARLSRMVSDGINASLPERGSPERYWDARRLADKINNPRAAIRLNELSPWQKKLVLARWPHRISED